MRTAILAAVVGLAALPACAFADDDDGDKRKEYWKKQDEFQKEQRKKEKEFLKEQRKREREYRKEAEKRQHEIEQRAWKRYHERRDFDDAPRRADRYYRPSPEDFYEPGPRYGDNDERHNDADRHYDAERRYGDAPPRLKGRGRMGPYRFEIWD
jgi:hypothetical protein